MATKIYVGNLSFHSSEEALRGLFEHYGPVHSVRVIEDHATGRSRGFGFVEMDADTGDTAIAALNGRDFDGRSLYVSEAKLREDRP